MITENEFQKILQHIRMHTGIRLPETNYRHVRAFLEDRCASLELSFDAYLARLSLDQEEQDGFIDAVTINETYFFREERHFRLLESFVFPALNRERADRLYFWSAACATGEEPLSLAALARRFWPDGGGKSFEILATDINVRSLTAFRRGVFTGNAFRRDGTAFHACISPFLHETAARHFILKPDLKTHIRIRRMNLFKDAPRETVPGFHLIFLRNSLIYMPPGVRSRILRKIASSLNPGGFLFLSASEVPGVSHPELETVDMEGIYFFRKKASPRMPAPLWKKSGVGPASVSMPDGDVRSGPSGEPAFRQEDIHARLSEVVTLINSGGTREARTALERAASLFPGHEIIDYLKGILEMERGSPDEGRRLFLKSLIRNSDFWPARFRLADLLRERSPTEALAHYEKGAELIEEYMEKRQNRYEYLLDDFSPHYFLEMCRKWRCRLQAHATGNDGNADSP